MPRIRRDAVFFARKHGVRKAARYFGFSPGAICAWKKKTKQRGYGAIPTESSRPKSHPAQLTEELADQIVLKRLAIERSAEVVHKELAREGIVTSLSSVKRTLDRRGLTRKRSPWKRYHAPVQRPEVKKAGDLVEVDTIHVMTNEKTRIYVFTLIDVYSRWAYARSYEKCNTRTALDFLKRAQGESLFPFLLVQSDHGSEFSTHFTVRSCVTHRHSRVRKPNDNAHLERFNRTIQEECLDHHTRSVRDFNAVLPAYLAYYNNRRLHFGISLQAPMELLAECSQAID